mgnify:CR=1 FL=1
MFKSFVGIEKDGFAPVFFGVTKLSWGLAKMGSLRGG